MNNIESNNTVVCLNNSIYDGDNRFEFKDAVCKLVRRQRLINDVIILAQFSFFVLLSFLCRNCVGILGCTIGVIIIIDFVATPTLFIMNRKGYGVDNVLDSGEIERFADYYWYRKSFQNIAPTIELTGADVKVDLVLLNGKYALEAKFAGIVEEIVKYIPIYIERSEEIDGDVAYVDLNNNTVRIGKNYKVKSVFN